MFFDQCTNTAFFQNFKVKSSIIDDLEGILIKCIYLILISCSVLFKNLMDSLNAAAVLFLLFNVALLIYSIFILNIGDKFK